MIVRDELIEVGVFNKPHGVNGEIVATLDFDIDVVKAFSCLIAEIDGIFVPFFVIGLREKTVQTILLQIDGINNEQDAALLVNKKIYVLQHEYRAVQTSEDDDEISIELLVGYEIVSNGSLMGKITDIDDTTANVLFVVTCENGNEVLIPVTDDFIDYVDTEHRQIHMSLPEELIKIQL